MRTENTESFKTRHDVSHGTVEKFELYERMLQQWSQRFNLVASSTLPDIWMRHFSDSAQLMKFLPSGTRLELADMGAGAGFPGLVLALLAQDQRRDVHVTAIESTGKKADFLESVVEKLELNASVRRDRIEYIKDYKADVITARALKPLPDLLKLSNHIAHKSTTCLFLKGRGLADELTAAKKYWTFKQVTHPSCSDDSGSVLVLNELRYKS